VDESEGVPPRGKAADADGNWCWSDPEVRDSVTSPGRSFSSGRGEPRPTSDRRGHPKAEAGDQRVATG